MNKEQILHRLNLISIQLLKENYRSAKQLVDDAFYQLSTGPTWKNLSEGFGMEGSPETKRYCLEIKYPVDEEYIKAAYLLRPVYDGGREIKPSFQTGLDVAIVYIGDNAIKIPSSWLVEIKEEKPYTSPRQWLNDKHPGSMPAHNYSHAHLMNAFIDGRTDYELRHRETETFEEWKQKIFGDCQEDNISNFQHIKSAWIAYAISRGYE